MESTYVFAPKQQGRGQLLDFANTLQLHENEVMRAYKTVNDLYIEPISFTVPRRAETFQSDIYPACTGSRAAVSSEEWFSGKTALPPKIDLESVYEGSAPVEVKADYKPLAAAAAPTPAPAPAPVAKPAPKEPEPTPVATRSPPPSMAQQKGSISAMASRFRDNEEDDDDAETSSFEEVSKPAPKASLPIKSEPKPTSPIRASAPVQQSKPASPPLKSPQTTSAPQGRAATSPVTSAAPGSATLQSSLEQIKQLIEAQTKIITAQSDKINAQSTKIGQLAGEMETLKKRVGSGSQEHVERIRQLELELEEARS